MSLERFKAQYGSISGVKLASIRNVSNAAYNVLVGLPEILRVVEQAMEVDVDHSDANFDELNRAIDQMEMS